MIKKEESIKLVKRLIKENKIIKPSKGVEPFFLNKAINSLQVSKRLLQISNDEKDSLEAYMWVINSAYYSMFFAATSILAHFKHKIDINIGIHKITYHALVYYFLIDDNKLQKHFIEEYASLYEDAEQLLQISEKKAHEVIISLDLEREKRSDFTYEMGFISEKRKAETSIKRANEFLTEVRKIIDNK